MHFSLSLIRSPAASASRSAACLVKHFQIGQVPVMWHTGNMQPAPCNTTSGTERHLRGHCQLNRRAYDPDDQNPAEGVSAHPTAHRSQPLAPLDAAASMFRFFLDPHEHFPSPYSDTGDASDDGLMHYPDSALVSVRVRPSGRYIHSHLYLKAKLSRRNF
jgi:hypothetical protein